MVPFSFFVTIPFAELLLPSYLRLFPNALPNGFRTPLQIKQVKDNLKSTQKNSHKKLHKMINKYLIEQGVEIRKLDQEEKIDEFVNRATNFQGKLTISQMDSETLIKIGEFLGLNMITGTKTLSTLYNSTLNIPTNVLNRCNKMLNKVAYTPKNGLFKR